MLRFRHLSISRIAAVLVSLLLCPAAVWAEDNAPVQGKTPDQDKTVVKTTAFVHPGTTEVGGFVGSILGMDSWRVMGGGNVAYAVTRVVMPYAEFSYFPGLQREATFPSGAVRFSVPVSDFHGGVHLRMPLGESRIVPYAVAGAGLLRYGDTRVSIRFRDGSTITDAIQGQSDFAANFGGGLRIYTKERIGFRFEAKVYKPTGRYTDPFYKVEGGFFIQFR